MNNKRKMKKKLKKNKKDKYFLKIFQPVIKLWMQNIQTWWANCIHVTPDRKKYEKYRIIH
jgi:hypothetical protein